MYKQFYQGMELAHLPLFALALFLGVFMAVVAWTFLVRRKRDFDPLALLPLQGEGEVRPTRGTEAQS